MFRQRTPEWRAARRQLITATDIPVILGLSPYKSESTLAQEKLGQIPEQDSNLFMDIGAALEPVIAREYERLNDVRLTRYRGLVTHKSITWAGASPDYRIARRKYLVELKDTRSRRWPDGGIPQDVEAQVRWQLGVTGFPVADVAALRWSQVESFTVEHDQALFEQLVAIAQDFRDRMAAGGPFSEDRDSIRSRYPVDDGSELTADSDIEALVHDLREWKEQVGEGESMINQIETDLKARMATATKLIGSGWTISWHKSKDSEVTDWKSVASAYRLLLDAQVKKVTLPDWLVKLGNGRPAQLLQPEMLDSIQSIHTATRPGGRSFRLYAKGTE